MAPFQSLHITLLLLSTAALISSKTVRVTIDDTEGDPTTQRRIEYAPSGGWNVGHTCDACNVKLDAEKLHMGTWHDGTSDAGGEAKRASVVFRGTSVWVQAILAGTEHTGFIGGLEPEFYFSINGTQVGSYVREAQSFPVDGGYQYNTTIFRDTELPLGDHTLEIRSGSDGGKVTLLLLDAVVYEFDDGTSESGDEPARTSEGPGEPTRTPNPGTDRENDDKNSSPPSRPNDSESDTNQPKDSDSRPDDSDSDSSNSSASSNSSNNNTTIILVAALVPSAIAILAIITAIYLFILLRRERQERSSSSYFPIQKPQAQQYPQGPVPVVAPYHPHNPPQQPSAPLATPSDMYNKDRASETQLTWTSPTPPFSVDTAPSWTQGNSRTMSEVEENPGNGTAPVVSEGVYSQAPPAYGQERV